jgi:hypothetical protein
VLSGAIHVEAKRRPTELPVSIQPHTGASRELGAFALLGGAGRGD